MPIGEGKESSNPGHHDGGGFADQLSELKKNAQRTRQMDKMIVVSRAAVDARLQGSSSPSRVVNEYGRVEGAEPRAAEAVENLAVVESHLTSIDAMTPPNRMMLDRITEAQQSGRALTVGEQNFLLHETVEAELVGQGLSQDAAHVAALETHPLFMNYDPEVIKAFPGYFNSNWRKAWRIS